MGPGRTLIVTFLVVLAAAIAFSSPSGSDDPQEIAEPSAPDAALADLVPYDGRSPKEEPGDEVRLLVRLRRPALGALPDARTLDARLQRRHVRSLERESEALRSGLEARGVRLGDVVTFERVYNGFAATVSGAGLRALSRAGLRTHPVRRFYPAVSEPIPIPEGRTPQRRERPGPGVALLAGGVDGPGWDVVDGDDDPAPGAHPADPARLETDGETLAAVLRAAGASVRPIRISAQRPEQYARTDELLAGLERAVDPDLDGDTADRASVALIAVNAPFAGFSAAPEARAATAARRLGTRVVAPAGNEGAGRTIGSPGGAPAAVTVGSLSLPEAVVRLPVTVAGETLPGAALGGPPPVRGLAGPVTDAEDPEELLRPGAPRLVERIARVRAGVNPVAQAAAAEAAGATAVVLAEPREDRVLPAIPAGRLRVPVVGVTGEAAEKVLSAATGAQLQFGATQVGEDVDAREAELSVFSSTGPTIAGVPKPNLAAPGWADVELAGRRVRVGGAGVAAARVAASLAGARRALTRRGQEAGAAGPGEVRPAPLGELVLSEERDGSRSVRFAAGAFDRGDPPAGEPARVEPVQHLELALVDDRGRRVRRLTPRGGTFDLLPGEYSFTLSRSALGGLAGRRYAFEARAWAPRQVKPTVRRSETFRP